MITYNKSKYSVETKYIGKEVEIRVDSNILRIYYNKNLIKEHNINENKKYKVNYNSYFRSEIPFQ